MVTASVILITYNSERTLQNTLDSILNQEGRGELFNLELIVVDDCSTDNTIEILKSNKISFYSNVRHSGGPNKGRNLALEIASGDYICFMDHDDVWMSDKLISQLKAAHFAPIITCGYCIIDKSESKVIQRSSRNSDPILYTENETFLAKLTRKNKSQNTYLSTFMIHKTLKCHLFEEHFGMCDFDWILKIFENNRSVEIPKVLMKRYVSLENLSLQEDYRKKDYYYSLFTLEKYEEKYPKQVAVGMKKVNGSRARYFYLIDKMKSARSYFLKGPIDLKTICFYITTFFGSALIRKSFRFFG
jgi:glycosyltransferase involved in cell wall biosynthesis